MSPWGQRATVVALLTGVLLGASGVPAHAADELELSADGTDWGVSLSDRIFAVPRYAVPGDVISSALWVRNASSDRARVELDVADDVGAVPGTLAGDLSVRIDGVPVSGGQRWHGPELRPGAVLRIPLVVTFDPASEASTSLDVTGVLESVSLVQTQAGPGVVSPTSPAVPAQPGHLARTGLDVARQLAVSIAAVGLGILLLAARRRPRRDDSAPAAARSDADD